MRLLSEFLHTSPVTLSVSRLLIASLWLFANVPLLASELGQYPRDVQSTNGSVRIHHPSVSDWKDFEVLSAWVPVEVKLKASEETWTGSVLVEADTDIDYRERLVGLANLRLVKAKADQNLSVEALALQQNPQARALVEAAIKQGSQSVALEYLLRALPEDFAAGLVKPVAGLNHSPPRIILSETPAMLMLLDGPPRTAAIRNSQLEIVVNTDWTVFHDTAGDDWYIAFGDYWLQNRTLSGGTWEVAASLPEDFSNLAMGNGWEGLAKMLPPKQTDRVPPPFKLSYEPAELILFDGPPQMQGMDSTAVQYAANSDHDLFVFEGRYYLLLSGRWFTTRDMKRKWSAVDQLPAEFAQIPADSEKAYVRAAVPGTEEFRVALIEASMPRSQSVASDSGEGLSVTYDGEPRFVNISGTPLGRAVNTSKQVLRHNNFYYLCQDAAWYSSTSATGPWRPAIEIPQAIYSIPPDDPAYNVTYVKLGSFDQETGRQAYIHTYGYSGTYTADQGVVHGTGTQLSGSYYDPTYDPRQRDWGYWGSYGYWPTYGYGASYYPHWGGYRYGGYYDPFWGYPYPYPSSTSTTIDLPGDEGDWEVGPDGEKRMVDTSPGRNYVGSGKYQADGLNTGSGDGRDDPTAAGHWYSGPDGRLYRITESGWQIQQGKKWVPITEPVPYSVTREYQARLSGYAAYERYQQEK